MMYLLGGPPRAFLDHHFNGLLACFVMSAVALNLEV